MSDTADASDHAGAANAISKGMIEGRSPQRPGYRLHTGGTGILTYFDSDVRNAAGEPDDKAFSVWDRVDELVNLPAAAFHRNVDGIVLKTGTEHADRVKTVRQSCVPRRSTAVAVALSQAVDAKCTNFLRSS